MQQNKEVVMKTRYFLTLVLAIVFMLALAACGSGNGDDNGNGTEGDQPQPTPAAQPTPAPEGDGEVETPPGVPTFEDDEAAWFDYHFPARDLGGVELRWSRLGNPYHENPIMAAEDEARRQRVQERFNVVLDMSLPNIYDIMGWGDVPHEMIASHAAGDPIVHFLQIYMGFWFRPMAQAGILMDMTDTIPNLFPPTYYEYFGEWHGSVYGFARYPIHGWQHLVYNREMIRATGIDYTPSEMFVQGRWSHDDFFDYMVRLNDLLEPDVYAFIGHPTNLMRKFVTASGGAVLNPRTFVPEFLQPEFLRAATFHQRVTQAGLTFTPTYNPDNSRYSLPAGGASFNYGEAAMTLSSCNAFATIGNFFEMGYVPPPWCNTMTFPASGDWRDFATVNPSYRAFLNDAWVVVSVEENALPGNITPEDVINMVFSFNENHAQNLVAARELHAQGLVAANDHLRGTDALWTPLDQELYHWFAARPTLHGTSIAGAGAFQGEYNHTVGGGGDFHANFSAILGSVVWGLHDSGILLEADIPPAMWQQMIEFGETLEQDED